MTPSCRFPLLAGGTEWTRGAVSLGKRGNRQEGGNCKLCPCDWYNWGVGSRKFAPVQGRTTGCAGVPASSQVVPLPRGFFSPVLGVGVSLIGMGKMAGDTIAAVATPPGEGGIGIIRVSGPQAFPIAERIFRRARAAQHPLASHRLYFGTIRDPETGEVLDHALLLTFRAPHSYTGEDVVEFSCHGSPLLLRRVLQLIWREGARPAQPGEFTQRAFLNGKLDLAQAEAVADLIRARTESQLRAALYLHEGALSRTIRQLSDPLLALLAQVEATIDFSEEIGELDRDAFATLLSELQTQLEQLLMRARSGRLLREGVRVAIVGRPNVGKSSLLNALLGEERAIVTPIPGTTRDLIEEAFQIQGVPIVVLDTAGLRENPDPVEQLGIERTRRAVEHADLLLVVCDLSEGLTEADCALLATLPTDKPRILVWNKADLVPFAHLLQVSPTSGENRLGTGLPSEDKNSSSGSPCLQGEPTGGGLQKPAERGSLKEGGFDITVRVSALTGEGLPTLCEAILDAVNLTGVGEESLLLAHERHVRAVETARQHLISALEATRAGLPLEVLAVDLRGAWLALGEITGETVDEQLVNRIFRDFCIGK
jgi:tRNA modification GTPase